jgi:hypothetical protein
MIYWTSYNFAGYILYKLKYIPLNSVLKTSFICTSLLGGYMVYIYPQKMIARVGEKKINVPYPLLLIGDFITHQLPLIDTFYKENQITLCGGYLLPTMFFWYSMNKIYVKETKKIYGIPLERLMISVLGIIGGIGTYQHIYLKNK